MKPLTILKKKFYRGDKLTNPEKKELEKIGLLKLDKKQKKELS
jgi:hypothetical protein